MGLENFILTCEKDNESLRKDINYYKNYNKRLKKENVINKAKENLSKHLNAKSYGNNKYELFDRKYLEEILEILDDKGEMKDE